MVEILDTSAGLVVPLLGTNNAPMSHVLLENNKQFCAVAIDELNIIVMSGGYRITP